MMSPPIRTLPTGELELTVVPASRPFRWIVGGLSLSVSGCGLAMAYSEPERSFLAGNLLVVVAGLAVLALLLVVGKTSVWRFAPARATRQIKGQGEETTFSVTEVRLESSSTDPADPEAFLTLLLVTPEGKRVRISSRPDYYRVADLGRTIAKALAVELVEVPGARISWWR
jgi:hypothetical protein